MSRAFFFLFLSIVSLLPAMANPRWKMHTTFDGEIDCVFDTPGYVYFTSRAMPDMNGQRRMSLFRYDKEGDEIQSLSTDNLLTSNTISAAQYCPQKGYVVVVATNFDITFLYDNGDTVTVPDYRLASLSDDKTVNAITIDPWHNRLYLATKFGYVAVNDEKHEIAESRMYGENIKSAARMGDYILMLKGTDLLAAKADEARFSLSDYDTIAQGVSSFLAPLSESGGIIFVNGSLNYIDDKTGIPEYRKIHSGSFYSKVNNKDGVLITTAAGLLQVKPEGEISVTECPELDYKLTTSSYNLTDIWQGKQRNGIKSLKIAPQSGEQTVTKDYMMPVSPAPFATPSFESLPSGGVLAVSHPHDVTFGSYPDAPLLVSGYKDGWWTNHAPIYADEERGKILTSPTGIAVDPDNPDYVYLGSRNNGLLRLNLNDGTDLIHMSKPADKDNGQPGFVELVPNQVGDNSWSCNFSAPRFDSQGNMWTVYADLDNQNPPRVHLFCWEAADRRATTSSADIRLPKKVEVMVDNFSENNTSIVVPLRHSKNKNRLIVSSRVYAGDIVMIDTKGTPTDPADDVVVSVTQFYDQDGVNIEPYRFRSLWEDPATGYVWVCQSTGVFYFDPDDFFKGGIPTMHRTKVARNDGTNLADRLLENVIVNNMTTDGSGRKWFATIGGGAVCTSSDGRTIEEQLSTGNSPLPSNDVYGLIYVPEHNSMLFSTAEGIAEYFLSGDGSSAVGEDLKIYPNPVRPDYFGYVTIEGLPDRSLVKIVDASGNIVKEFGPVSGDVQWDVTNHQFRRVSSGVYFVLASAGENENAFSSVGKILVVN